MRVKICKNRHKKQKHNFMNIIANMVRQKVFRT
jgi:hypothetical protein